MQLSKWSLAETLHICLNHLVKIIYSHTARYSLKKSSNKNPSDFTQSPIKLISYTHYGFVVFKLRKEQKQICEKKKRTMVCRIEKETVLSIFPMN